MRFVSQCHERASFYCYQTVDICAWRRTLRWCRGTTSGRQCSQGARNVRNFNVTCKRQQHGVAGDAAVSTVKPRYRI